MSDIGTMAAFSGAIILFLLVPGVCILGVVCEAWPAVGQRLWIRVCGALLVLAGVSVSVFCYLGPDVWFFVLHAGGRPLREFPRDWTPIGKTPAEVRTALGPPHTRYSSQGNERWDYYCDSLGVGYYAVIFGPDGRVENAFGG